MNSHSFKCIYNGWILIQIILFLLLQSVKNGTSIPEETVSAESERWQPRGSSWRVRSRGGRTRQFAVVRPLQDRPGAHHQPRCSMQILSTTSLQSLSRVQSQRNRLGLHHLLQKCVSIDIFSFIRHLIVVCNEIGYRRQPRAGKHPNIPAACY